MVCAALLSTVGWATQERREENAQAERVRNILGVLGIETAPGASAGELVEVFEEKVEAEDEGDLVTYVYQQGGEIEAVAVPFEGPGLVGADQGFSGAGGRRAHHPGDQLLRAGGDAGAGRGDRERRVPGASCRQVDPGLRGRAGDPYRARWRRSSS